MEFGVRELVQFSAILVSISGAFYAARSQIKNLMEKMINHEKRLLTMDHRLDEAESARAVIDSRVNILSQINSVSALEQSNRELGELKAIVGMLREEVALLRKIHMGCINNVVENYSDSNYTWCANYASSRYRESRLSNYGRMLLSRC